MKEEKTFEGWEEEIKLLTEGSWNQIKGYIVPLFITAKMDREYVKTLPHLEVEDLLIEYRFEMRKGNDNGVLSANVTWEMLNEEGISFEELHKTAVENVVRKNTAVFGDALELIEKMSPETAEKIKARRSREYMKAITPGDKIFNSEMLVLTNLTDRCGTNVILDDNFMDTVSEVMGNSFYLLPSSVHEWIAVRKTEDDPEIFLEALVREVNRTRVAPAMQLSNHVYLYNRDTHSLRMCNQAMYA